MALQDGSDPSITDHTLKRLQTLKETIQTQSDSQRLRSGKNYIILKAWTLAQTGETELVSIVVHKPVSYEEAIETAIEVFEIPESFREGLTLRCRFKGSSRDTEWMKIQPAVWNDVVEDMEFHVY